MNSLVQEPPGNRGLHNYLFYAVLALTATLAGCGTPRPIQYYKLQLPASPTTSLRGVPVTLVVGQIAAPSLLRDDAILYMSGPTKVGTYEYRRWFEPPVDMIQEMLIHLLRESGHYKNVEPQRSSSSGDYLLRGTLHDFEEMDFPSLTARIGMDFQLVDLKTGTAVWSANYFHDEPVSGSTVDAVVEAFNRNLQQGLVQVTNGLNQFLSAKPRQ